jgi:hypothetical protein
MLGSSPNKQFNEGGQVAVRKQLHEHFCSVATLTRPANADKPQLSGLLAMAAATPPRLDLGLGAEMAKSAQPRTIAGFLAAKRGWVKRRPIQPRHLIIARPQLLLEQRPGQHFPSPVRPCGRADDPRESCWRSSPPARYGAIELDCGGFGFAHKRPCFGHTRPRVAVSQISDDPYDSTFDVSIRPARNGRRHERIGSVEVGYTSLSNVPSRSQAREWALCLRDLTFLRHRFCLHDEQPEVAIRHCAYRH